MLAPPSAAQSDVTPLRGLQRQTHFEAPTRSQVEGKQDSLLVRGTLVAYAVVYPTGERRLALEVGEVRWWLLTDTASLKAAPLTYMMALPGGQIFHSITFAEDTPVEVSSARHIQWRYLSVSRG